QICMLEQQFDQARQWLEKAIDARPDDPAPWIVLSSLLFREGRDWARCLEVHARAVALDPGQIEVRRRLEQLRAMQVRRAVPAAVPEMPVSGVHPAVAQFSNLGAGSGLSFS